MSQDEQVDRILDAAGRAFAEHGVRRTRMGQVADAAGCSRATLYRYFVTKEALVVAYAVREAERTARHVEQRIVGMRRLGDRLVEAMASSVEAVRASPAVMPFLSPDAQGLTFALPAEAPAMGPPIAAAFAAILAEHDGSERLRGDAPANELLEWMVRIVLSLALVPGPLRSSAELREALGRLVRPAFVEPSGPP